MNTITENLPLLLRQTAVILSTALLARGIITPEQGALIGANIDQIIAGLILFGTLGYQLWANPSKKAREVATQVDKHVPANAEVVIKTPTGVPDITIPGKE